MKVSIKLDENDIRSILANYINNNYGTAIAADSLRIEVKSKQNYRSEWEHASIRLEQELMS
jgi:hypothetical protein